MLCEGSVECDRAVGERASAQDACPPLCNAGLELGGEARLADARLADDCHEVGLAFADDAVEDATENRGFVDAPHHGDGLENAFTGAGPGTDRQPSTNRRALALRHQWLHLPILDETASGTEGLLADEDATSGCRRLQA